MELEDWTPTLHFRFRRDERGAVHLQQLRTHPDQDVSVWLDVPLVEGAKQVDYIEGATPTGRRLPWPL